MKRRILFRSADSREVETLRAWHSELKAKEHRGDRARLKRCGTIEDAAMAPAFHQLLRRLGVSPSADDAQIDARQLTSLAAVAVLAASLDDDQPGASLGRQMSSPRKDSTSPRVSEARFRRLLQSDDVRDRFGDLRRILALLGKNANLADVAGAACDWTSRRQRKLAYDYYGNVSSKSKENPT